MTNDEAFARLRGRGVSSEGALRVLNYAYQAQYVGGWDKLMVTDQTYPMNGGSEGAKGHAMDIFRDAGIDPMTISFPEKISGKAPFGVN